MQSGCELLLTLQGPEPTPSNGRVLGHLSACKPKALTKASALAHQVTPEPHVQRPCQGLSLAAWSTSALDAPSSASAHGYIGSWASIANGSTPSST